MAYSPQATEIERGHYIRTWDYDNGPDDEWVGPDLPDTFNIDHVDGNECAAGLLCAHARGEQGRTVGFTAEGWEPCYMIDGQLVVCEDCMIDIDMGELVIDNGVVRLAALRIVK